MRMKVRTPKTTYQEVCKITSRSITVSACEYSLMMFIGACMYLKEKSKVRKYDIYRGKKNT
jgi:hypothetical protein